MGKFWAILIVLVLVGCSPKVSKDDLRHLNGYWEIEKVVFPDGTVKEYKVNISVDYIKIDGLTGFRKKVQPKFDGTYTATNDAEPFRVMEKQGVFDIAYKNDLSEWSEQIVTLSEDYFSVINEENITYSYKRYRPINAKD